MLRKILSITENRYVLFGIATISLLVAILAWKYPTNTNLASVKMGVVTNIQPINVDGNINRNDLRIIYKDKNIENPTYIKIKIQNDGTIPLTDDYFVEPLQIFFPTESEILDFSVDKPELMTASQTSQNSIGLHSSLLNPEDTVDIRVLLNAPSAPLATSNIRVKGRIVGIQNLHVSTLEESDFLGPADQKTQARKSIINMFMFFGLIAVVIAILALLQLLSDYKGENKYIKYLSIGVFGTILAGVFGGMLFMVLKFIYIAAITLYIAFA